MEFVRNSKGGFLQEAMPVAALFYDRILGNFFKEAFKDEKIDVKIGSPKANFNLPSVYVTCSSYQAHPFLGSRLAVDKLKQKKLDIQYEEDPTTNTVIVKSNLHSIEPYIKYRGTLLTANAKITVYSDNYSTGQDLAESVISLLYFNYTKYLSEQHLFDKSIKNDRTQWPIMTGFQLNGMVVDYDQEVAAQKGVWSVSFLCSFEHFARIEERYGYITGYKTTANVKVPVTNELVETIERDITIAEV